MGRSALVQTSRAEGVVAATITGLYTPRDTKSGKAFSELVNMATDRRKEVKGYSWGLGCKLVIPKTLAGWELNT